MIKRTLIFIFISFQIFAQDTISFRTGQILAVRVNEITRTEIRYNRFDNLDGPLYSCTKDEVSQIKYNNGQIETFTLSVPVNNNEIIQNKIAGKDRIEFYNRKLYYHDHFLDDDELSHLIEKYPDKQTSKQMRTVHEEMNRQKRNQLIFGIGGPVLGFGIYIGGTFLKGYFFPPKSQGATVFSTATFVVGLSLAVVGNSVSSRARTQRYRAAMQLARLYNN